MKKILLMLFIMVAVISNNAKAQFNYYASVEGGGGVSSVNVVSFNDPINDNTKATGVSSDGVGVVGATGTISYGEKIEWGFTTGLKSYFGAVTSEDKYIFRGSDGFLHLDRISSNKSAVLIVPLIVSVTYNFTDIIDVGSVIPFLSINGGYGLQVNASDVVRANNYTYGMEAGIKHKNIKGSIFYTNQGYTHYMNDYQDSELKYTSIVGSHLNTVGAKITYCFNGIKKSSKVK